MSNITRCDSGSFSTENTREDAAKQSEILGQFHSPHSHTSTTTTNNSNGSNTNSQPPAPVKKKRSLPGNPDLKMDNQIKAAAIDEYCYPWPAHANS
ncbi:hypothetical protein E2542_SST30743 [Spatholobus suberectus]|nr:hypothetical protein E2542_SST30743 [Spatholobus suberectus]